MSLTNKFSPGDPLDADPVEQNFTDLATQVNAIGAAQIRDGSIWSYQGLNVMNVAPVWKDAQVATDVGFSLVPAGAPAQRIWTAADPTFNTGLAGEPLVSTASVQLSVSGVIPHVNLQLHVNGAAVGQDLAYRGGFYVAPAGTGSSRMPITLYYILENPAGATFTAALYSQPDTLGNNPAGVTLTDPQIEVLAVTA